MFLLIFILNPYLLYPQTLNDAILESQKLDYKKSLKILKKLPQTHQVLKHLGWTYLKLGKYAKASKVFLKISHQNNYEILFGLGLSDFFAKHYENAYLYFTKCLDINKNCAAAEFFLGEIRNNQQKFDEAIKHYKNTLKLDYNFIEARIKLARLYYTVKQYDNSFKEYTTLLNINPH
ncbi:MAG: hypothetical protein AB1349_08825 [Elusimicrobiota bacterium]